MHPNQAPSRSRPYSLLANRYPSRPTASYHLADTQAELIAFTPSLMSLQFHQQGYRPNRPMNYRSPRPYVQNSPSFVPVRTTAPSAVPQKSKSETTVSPPEYYVDSFASNFSDKPSSNSASQTKAKHVSFQEPEMMRSVVSFSRPASICFSVLVLRVNPCYIPIITPLHKSR